MPALLLTLSELASAGDCTHTNAGVPQTFTFDFNAEFTSPEENAPQKIMPNAYEWNLGQDYLVTCACDGGVTKIDPPVIFYTSRSSLTPGRSASVEGKTVQFFQVNRNIQVAGEIFVAGDRHEYLPFPFTNESNWGSRTAKEFICQQGASTNGLTTGSRGRLHLMIDRPFIGESIIPLTKLVSLTGATQRGPSSNAPPVAEVWMSGRVVVPQSCQLAAGQSTVIDFGALNPSEIGVPGEAPRRSESRTFSIQCENIAETVLIDLSLVGAPHPQQPNLLAVNARQDLAIDLRNEGRNIAPLPSIGLVAPTPGQIIPINFSQAQQQGSFDLEAYPVRMADQVAPGPFTSQVTLLFEFR